jgi:hypothetical protein
MSGTPEGTKILDALRRGVFDELIPPLDVAAVERARARQAILTKPPGSLGRLEDIAVFCAGVWGVDPSGVEPLRDGSNFRCGPRCGRKGRLRVPPRGDPSNGLQLR